MFFLNFYRLVGGIINKMAAFDKKLDDPYFDDKFHDLYRTTKPTDESYSYAMIGDDTYIDEMVQIMQSSPLIDKKTRIVIPRKLNRIGAYIHTNQLR